MSIRATNQADVSPLRPVPAAAPGPGGAPLGEPLWRDLVGDVLRRERKAQGRTLKEMSEASRISLAYLSEVERGRKEASSEVLAAAARALGLTLADVLALAGERLVSLTAARSRIRSRASVADGGRRPVREAAPARPTGPTGPARRPVGALLLAA
ncbi:helix-turn-helix transcriptional regulator [Streptomyces californicus]|uniref:Helix-turn-helix transcriptional regulator n=1 Tax=Streptomyces californicus TaxID=67351 RepID=A0ABD7D0L3_9ACTN|nr:MULTISPECIES: helix-turn-helix transcriptional regulator [Streptomyces]MYW77364.1 helix-turn-helix domain-containing protein [Streptomyces sp. SID8369]QRV29794.1 helix-turn-helix transcriptional regulator [Streptomyces californicus]QRV34598.1 helix-turn-helix transcriptional regulator [Streptomyces californicus]QRV43209.1 helix-turn-helix transcriptional regulator [Streptomyces californicus]QRV49896.1 helix-turn-helix transcriptional regulator [Streptomyces californicus]